MGLGIASFRLASRKNRPRLPGIAVDRSEFSPDSEFSHPSQIGAVRSRPGTAHRDVSADVDDDWDDLWITRRYPVYKLHSCSWSLPSQHVREIDSDARLSH